MTRYSPQGKRIVRRPPKAEVPPELLADIDGLAVKVTDLRDDRDDLRRQVRELEHDAHYARLAADQAVDPEARKRLYDKAGELAQRAGSARAALARTEKSLIAQETALGGLHGEARAWQRGEREEG